MMKAAEIGLALYDVMTVFMPGPNSKATLKAAKEGGMAAAKAAFKKQMREFGKELLKSAAQNLGAYMVDQGKMIKQQVRDDIMNGGVESIGAYNLMEDRDLKDVALEVLGAVDPTGIHAAVQAFDGGGRCRDNMLDMNFPVEGLERQTWIRTKTPAYSWDQAAQSCAGAFGQHHWDVTLETRLCTREEICWLGWAGGETPDGGFVDGDAWTPVSNEHNQWVSIGFDRESSGCRTWTEVHGGKPDTILTSNICCVSSNPPPEYMDCGNGGDCVLTNNGWRGKNWGGPKSLIQAEATVERARANVEAAVAEAAKTATADQQ